MKRTLMRCLKLLYKWAAKYLGAGKTCRSKLGWKNVTRMDDKLGPGTSEAEIRAVLVGEKRHTPRKNSAVQPEPPKVNLLVDIRAKGAGWKRCWLCADGLQSFQSEANGADHEITVRE